MLEQYVSRIDFSSYDDFKEHFQMRGQQKPVEHGESLVVAGAGRPGPEGASSAQP